MSFWKTVGAVVVGGLFAGVAGGLAAGALGYVGVKVPGLAK